MSRVPRALVAGLVVVGVVVATATSALADEDDVPTELAQAALQAPPPPPPPRLVVKPDDLAEFFGISVEQLKQELRAGQSLAQVAAEQGKTTATLETFITAE